MRIGNVAKVQGGYAFKSSEFISKGTPIIRIGNLDGEKVLIDTNICYTEKFWEEHKEFRINKGDILVAMSGATVGKIGLYNYEDKALLNQRVGNILPKKNVIKEYLYYYCMSPAFRRNIEEKAFGCAQPNISAKQIEDFSISIPSIEEQEKAVKIFEKTYSIIRNRKQQLEDFDNLIKSRFVEMFGDVKINNMGWETSVISDCFEVKGGKRIPKAMGYSDEITDHPYLRATDMKNATILDDDIKYITDEVFQKIKRYTVNAGDIYLTNVGVNLGMAGVIPSKYQGANLTENAIKLVPKQDKINGVFLSYYINSPGIQDYINERKMSVGVPKLAIFRIETMPLIIPPIGVQNDFVHFCEQTDKLKVEVQKSLDETEMLFDSLMQQYFE